MTAGLGKIAARGSVRPLFTQATRTLLLISVPAGALAYLGSVLVQPTVASFCLGVALGVGYLALIALLSPTERANLHLMVRVMFGGRRTGRHRLPASGRFASSGGRGRGGRSRSPVVLAGNAAVRPEPHPNGLHDLDQPAGAPESVTEEHADRPPPPPAQEASECAQRQLGAFPHPRPSPGREVKRNTAPVVTGSERPIEHP